MSNPLAENTSNNAQLLSTQSSASSFVDRKNIILIGMPGAGKSTVGVVLAKMLNYEFIDVDLVIQQRMQKTLQQLIDELGAEGFIALEGEVLAGLSPTRAIISTGGSAIYSQSSIDKLAQNGHVVYLQISLDILRKRLGDLDERGVVIRYDDRNSDTNSDDESGNISDDENGHIGDNVDILAALYNERIPLYEAAAEFTVCADNVSISDTARAIRNAVNFEE